MLRDLAAKLYYLDCGTFGHFGLNYMQSIS